MSNLVLLCRFHHREVEPPDVGPPVWGVRLRGQDGLPEFVPPAEIDPERKPVMHSRFLLRGAKPSPPAAGPA
jgi:hypothetical protein